MSTFIVKGGKTLRGVYYVSGAKNSAPKLLITAMLTDKPCLFHNIPRFSDTFLSLKALSALGAQVKFVSRNSVEIICDKLCSYEIPQEAQSARQSVLFIGASLARLGKVKIFPPKGDAIGKRPLNRHLAGIKALGGQIKERGNFLFLTLPVRPPSVTYRFEKNTHCGTENLILASVFNQGKVVLENAAEEPEVDNLIACLNKMGAQIKRIQPRTIIIRGVKPLLNSVEETSLYDRLEAATAIVLSILTGGQVEVANTPYKLVTVFTKKLEEIGIDFSWQDNLVKIKKINYPLRPTQIVTDRHPGFMTDWQPLIALVLATLAQGKSIIHERIFEHRWRYLKELAKMGVRYKLFHPKGFSPQDYNFNNSEYRPLDPYGAYIWGPTELQPAQLTSHDVRAGIDVLLAALVAKGESVIYDPQNHIDRGYENIVEKLNSLGAEINRES